MTDDQGMTLRPRMWDRYHGQWVLAFLFALVLFTVTYAVQPVFYQSNDDGVIMKAVSGYLTGTPISHHVYVNAYWTAFLAFLYRLAPAVQWYTVFSIAAIFVSETVLCRTLLVIVRRKKMPVAVAAVLFVLLYAAVLFFPTVLMQFTMTSALLCAASLALLCTAGEAPGRGNWIVEHGCSLLLLLIGLCVRNSSWLAGLCFWLLAIAVRGIRMLCRKEPGRVKKSLLLAVYAAAAVTACVLVMKSGDSRKLEGEAEGYSAYFSARAQYMDYPILSYDEAPELYDSLGWDAELYDMTSWWFTMDTRVDTEALSAIVQASKGETNETLSSMWACLSDALEPNQLASAFNVFLLTLLVLNVFAAVYAKHTCWYDVLWFCCAFTGYVLMCGYLAWHGRLVSRAYYAVALPVILTLILTFLRQCDDGAFRHIGSALNGVAEKKRIGLILACAIALGGGVFSVSHALQCCTDKALLAEAEQCNTNMESMEEYAAAHAADIFIYDRSLSQDTRIALPAGQSYKNLFYWGGTDSYNAVFAERIASLGLSEMYADVLYRDNAYYIHDTRRETEVDYQQIMLAYMNKRYGSTQLEPVADLGSGVIVYRVLRGETEN